MPGVNNDVDDDITVIIMTVTGRPIVQCPLYDVS